MLTLLGVENEEEDFSSSSEDEGVELDEESDEDDDEPENTRLLHQLAASLAEELKYSQKQLGPTSPSSTRLGGHQRGGRVFAGAGPERPGDQFQSMEIGPDAFHQADTKSSKFSQNHGEQTLECKSTIGRSHCPISSSSSGASPFPPRKFRPQARLRLASGDEDDDEETVFTGEATGVSGSWAAGWDACAAEAIRYLVEEEGLSPNHPTVLAMKGHLETQRERALAQYAM